MRMRLWMLPAALLLLAAGAHAQGTEIMSDAAGDVSLQAQGTDTAYPGPAEGIDLLGLTVEETETDLLFTLRLASTASADVDPSAGSMTLDFVHKDAHYRIQYGRNLQGYAWANLYSFDPDQGTYSWEDWLEVTVDEAEGTLSVRVERQSIPDSRGAAPFPGRTLSEFWASSRTQYSTGFGQVVDRMPDDGVSNTVVEIKHGIQQVGNLRLASQDPFRASNGEATTYVFEIDVENIASEDDEVRLTATGIPAGWEVLFPVERVAVDADESETFPVVVRTPFAHQHGVRASFLVEARSSIDPISVGRVELGVLFLEVPQPSGHHDTLWLHSEEANSQVSEMLAPYGLTFDRRQLYMNGLEEFEGDAKVPVPAGGSNRGALGVANPNYNWFVWLSNGLEMGLDFDLNRNGTLHLPVSSQTPLIDSRLAGYVMNCYREDDDWSCDVLADIGPSDPKSIDAGQTAIFDVAATPTEESDLVPYRQESYMFMQLWLSGTGPSSGGSAMSPSVMPGGWIQLPLLEYHDPVDDTFGTGVELSASVQEQLVNPGETVHFQVDVRNRGDEDATYRIDVLGEEASWATAGTDKLSVAAGKQSRVTIAVQAPANAQDGMQADLVVEAVDVADPLSRGLVRILATVDNDADHPDMGAAPDESEDKDSPLPVAILVAAIAVAVAVRKRD